MRFVTFREKESEYKKDIFCTAQSRKRVEAAYHDDLRAYEDVVRKCDDRGIKITSRTSTARCCERKVGPARYGARAKREGEGEGEAAG